MVSSVQQVHIHKAHDIKGVVLLIGILSAARASLGVMSDGKVGSGGQ